MKTMTSGAQPPTRQRGEYGESPVIPIDYPADSPYAVQANGNGNGNGDGNGAVVVASAVVTVELGSGN